MKDHLYFAADLAYIIIALVPHRTPPVSLWFKSSGIGEKIQPGWLLTPSTYARIIYQCNELEKRYFRGEYPLAKLQQIAAKLEPINDFAIRNLDLKSCEDAWDWLENHGGPRGKLELPDALPPIPFDLAIVVQEKKKSNQRYNGYTRKWEPVERTVKTSAASK